MKINPPLASRKVASQIANAWHTGGANFILVAPPLTQSEDVFTLLQDESFQEECGLDIEKLAFATLPPSSYGTSQEFVRRVLMSWELNVPSVTSDHDVLELLEEALQSLEQQQKTPIILLPQFHKTIQKLSWTLGSVLRELEVSYGLCTVAEVPVPLSQLRDRWEVTEGKETFICSDFGQGHSMIMLSGYNNTEIVQIVQNNELESDYAEMIQTWSGGFPALVHWLVREAKQSKSTIELKTIARKGSVEQCRRFLNWLDAPNTNFFKDLLSMIWQCNANAENRSIIGEHDWKDVLIDRRGNLTSSAIGYACTNYGGAGYSQALTSLMDAIERGEKENVVAIIDGLSEAIRSDQRIKVILAVVPLWLAAKGLSPNWADIEKSAKTSSRFIQKNHPDAIVVESRITSWYKFAKGINKMDRLAKRNKRNGWRLSDSLSGRENTHVEASVQVVLYRLSEANKLTDSTSALKSVLEIPEQILQIYCGRKLGLSVWQAPEFDEEEIDQVRVLWKRGEYRVPEPNSRLGFKDLLYFSWVRMQHLVDSERLFDSFTDLDYWCVTYEEVRNQPAHSITFESDKNWVDFYSRSIKLAHRLTISLTGATATELLPDLELVVTSLAGDGFQL